MLKTLHKKGRSTVTAKNERINHGYQKHYFLKYHSVPSFCCSCNLLPASSTKERTHKWHNLLHTDGSTLHLLVFTSEGATCSTKFYEFSRLARFSTNSTTTLRRVSTESLVWRSVWRRAVFSRWAATRLGVSLDAGCAPKLRNPRCAC